MLIAFTGAPCSGKTTTAARVFADLKDAGYPAEFLPEFARTYIAYRRLKGDTSPLTDNDQVNIMQQQSEAEGMMALSSPDSIVVADSAALNALLYMSPELRNLPHMQENARHAVARYGLVFRCHPVRPGSMYDPNRVHDFNQSLAIDAQVEPLLKEYGLPIIPLGGPQHHRATRAYGLVLEALVQEATRAGVEG